MPITVSTRSPESVLLFSHGSGAVFCLIAQLAIISVRCLVESADSVDYFSGRSQLRAGGECGALSVAQAHQVIDGVAADSDEVDPRFRDDGAP